MSSAPPASLLDYYRSWLAYRRWFLRVPGVQVAAAQDGQPVFSAAFGLADLSTGAPLTEQHLFRVASHSKTFTAVAVLQLVERGRLRLDDPVGALLPELAGSPVAAITIGELLSHGGGVIRDSTDGDFWQLQQDFPDRDRLLAIATGPDVAVLQRNERFKYSNIGYGLLGLVLETVTGTSFGQLIHSAIVSPLGLRDTGPELPTDRREQLAAGHTGLAGAGERDTIEHVDTAALAAATGCYATAADLVAFYSALLPVEHRPDGQHQLLDADSLRLLRHRQWDTRGVESGYGFGVFLTKVGDRTVYGHSGGYPGHITRTMADPDSGLAVSALTNAIDGPADPLAMALYRLVDLAAAATHEPAADADRFIGRYSSLWGLQDVADLDGRLFAINPTLVNPAEDAVPLEQVDERTLKIVGGPGSGSYGELVRFEFAEDGTARSMRGVSGMTMTPWQLPDQ